MELLLKGFRRICVCFTSSSLLSSFASSCAELRNWSEHVDDAFCVYLFVDRTVVKLQTIAPAFYQVPALSCLLLKP
jgi:hypothetical protein